MARRIRAGTLMVNGGMYNAPDVPFGGYRQSGLGRESGSRRLRGVHGGEGHGPPGNGHRLIRRRLSRGPGPASSGGDGLQETRGPVGPGLVHHPSVPEEHDPVGPRRHLGVVGHDHAATPRLHAPGHQPHHRFAVGRVEGAGRLVRQEQPPFPDHGARDSDPLTFATGQLIGVVDDPVAEAKSSSTLVRSGAPAARMPSSSRATTRSRRR